MATVNDVIRLSGVSRSTINRFLRGDNIRPEKEALIVKAMKELGYRTDKLANRKKHVVEIVSSNNGRKIFFHGFADMLMSMIRCFEEKGATVQLASNIDNFKTTADGVVVFGLNDEQEEKIIASLTKAEVPFVMAYRYIERSGVSFVTCDNYKAAFEMTEMLISRGHRKIAVCGDTKVNRNMAEKFEGFKDCLKNHGIGLDGRLVNNSGSGDSALGWMHEIIKMKDGPTAFFGLRDKIAIRFENVAAQEGIRIPEDISVVGMDGTIEAVYATPKLTTVTIPFELIGKKCAETLLELIEDPETTSIRRIIKYSIACRESV